MTVTRDSQALFCLSFDTELAWGHLDKLPPDMLSATQLRQTIARLLDILDRYGIVATWGVVGHLFFERCQSCGSCALMSWAQSYATFPRIYQGQDPLFYGADIVDQISARPCGHELAFHGYTHRIFDERQMTAGEARVEIEGWLRAASSRGIDPQSVIFPQNRPAFLTLFKEYGFVCYRGHKRVPASFRIPFLGRVLNRLDILFDTLQPDVSWPTVDASGLVNMRGSQWLFNLNRRAELLLDGLGLSRLRLHKIVRGIDAAARGGGVMHLWAHPYEFRTEHDFEKLEHVLAHVRKLVETGSMVSITMADMAQKTLECTAP